jgi:hypothetical protein
MAYIKFISCETSGEEDDDDVLLGCDTALTLANTVHRSRAPQGMRALRQCKVPRAEVMFVTIQRENILPSNKEINKDITMLIIKLPDVCS